MHCSQHPSINPSDALICFGSTRGCASHVSHSPSLCFSRAFLQAVLPSVFPCVACNTRYLSPSNIYLLSIAHLRSVYILSICMRPQITSVMGSHSAEISTDVGNLSAWEWLPQCTATHLQSTASFGSRGCNSHRTEPELSFFYISTVEEYVYKTGGNIQMSHLMPSHGVSRFLIELFSHRG